MFEYILCLNISLYHKFYYFDVKKIKNHHIDI